MPGAELEDLQTSGLSEAPISRIKREAETGRCFMRKPVPVAVKTADSG